MPDLSHNPNQMLLILASSTLGAACVCWFAYEVVRLVCREVDLESENWEFDKRRDIALHQGNLVYRWFAPLVHEIKDSPIVEHLTNKQQVDLALRRGGSSLPFRTADFLGTTFVESLIFSIIIGSASIWATGLTMGILIGFASLVVIFKMRVSDMKKNAEQRMRDFRQRLPFAIDLMALMLEAGGEIRQCLSIVVAENDGHPVGEELGRIERSMQGGTSLLEALSQVQRRLDDESLGEVVFSIRSAEELGTPLGNTFLGLASQMRLKRSQNAEKLVGEAATMLPMANLIIMVAGLLIIVAPYAILMLREAPF